MEVISSIDDVKGTLKIQKSLNKTIGFVPTMGYLHEGHLSLVDEAKKHTDYVVSSIFVNPTQFGPNEDFEKYPIDIERDKSLAEQRRVDLLFCPSAKNIYADKHNTWVKVDKLTQHLCGSSRPIHFQGVTTICTKLFNIIKPDKAFFGQKDAQQAFVIRRMIKDLNMDLNIVVCPTIREHDGLAMSSRNIYLTSEQRKEAVCLNHALSNARELFNNGEKNVNCIITLIIETINKYTLARIDYVSVVDTELLQPVVDEIKNEVLVAIAVYFDKIRLIDNVILSNF